MTENFGDTPETFDFDAWLDQGARPQRTVTVYSAWHLAARLAELEAQIESAASEDDGSMADDGGEELREQWQDVADELAASGRSFVLQALNGDEIATITAGIPDIEVTFTDQHGKEQARLKPDKIAVGDALVAEALVSPKLNRDQVRALREKLGDGPTLVLYETVGELRTLGKDLPTVPFSPASSDYSPE